MNNDCVEVDELILEIADYKNDCADMAAEKLLRKCSTSLQAYQYLWDRITMAGYRTVHDSSCDGYQEDSAHASVSRIRLCVRGVVTQLSLNGAIYLLKFA